MDWPLWKAFSVHWHLRVLYDARHIHPFTHTYIHTLKAVQGAEEFRSWNSVSWPMVLRHAERGSGGIRPHSLPIVDDPLYLLRHSRPRVKRYGLMSTQSLRFECWILFSTCSFGFFHFKFALLCILTVSEACCVILGETQPQQHIWNIAVFSIAIVSFNFFSTYCSCSVTLGCAILS